MKEAWKERQKTGTSFLEALTPAHRLVFPGAFLWAFLWAVLWVGLTAGCQSVGYGERSGGLADREAARVSMVVAQTRAQFPEFSGVSLPFDYRKEPTLSPAGDTVPVLRGEGVKVTPGVQRGGRERLLFHLYLHKPGYSTGRLESFPVPSPAGPGQPAATGSNSMASNSMASSSMASNSMVIVAYDKRGEPGEKFEFIYLLRDDRGDSHYLALIGGSYKEQGVTYQGFEGTLLTPGEDGSLEKWRHAYKINFGYRFAVPPEHQGLVEKARRKFRDTGRDISRLKSLLGRLKKPAGKEEARLTEEAGREAVRLAEDFQEYFRLRTSIAGRFADYLESNQYHWLNADEQLRVFDDWSAVEFHHPRIDERVEWFLTTVVEALPQAAAAAEQVAQARRSAIEVVRRHDNWSRYPGKKPTEAAPEQDDGAPETE